MRVHFDMLGRRAVFDQGEGVFSVGFAVVVSEAFIDRNQYGVRLLQEEK